MSMIAQYNGAAQDKTFVGRIGRRALDYVALPANAGWLCVAALTKRARFPAY
jgi:hypothetical protein